MFFLRFALSSSMRLVGLAACVLAFGCAEKKPAPPSASETNLRMIGRAYATATAALNRPPRNSKELKPYLAQLGASEDALRSPNDGEEYVILWNVKPQDLGPQGSDPKQRKFPVLAYEKTGGPGGRFVLTVPNRVNRMKPEELRNACFPPGHKPPD
jgi:hypothetical protein